MNYVVIKVKNLKTEFYSNFFRCPSLPINVHANFTFFRNKIGQFFRRIVLNSFIDYLILNSKTHFSIRFWKIQKIIKKGKDLSNLGAKYIEHNILYNPEQLQYIHKLNIKLNETSS